MRTIECNKRFYYSFYLLPLCRLFVLHRNNFDKMKNTVSETITSVICSVKHVFDLSDL